MDRLTRLGRDLTAERFTTVAVILEPAGTSGLTRITCTGCDGTTVVDMKAAPWLAELHERYCARRVAGRG